MMTRVQDPFPNPIPTLPLVNLTWESFSSWAVLAEASMKSKKCPAFSGIIIISVSGIPHMHSNVFAVQICKCKIECLNLMSDTAIHTHTLYFAV